MSKKDEGKRRADDNTRGAASTRAGAFAKYVGEGDDDGTISFEDISVGEDGHETGTASAPPTTGSTDPEGGILLQVGGGASVIVTPPPAPSRVTPGHSPATRPASRSPGPSGSRPGSAGPGPSPSRSRGAPAAEDAASSSDESDTSASEGEVPSGKRLVRHGLKRKKLTERKVRRTTQQASANSHGGDPMAK